MSQEDNLVPQNSFEFSQQQRMNTRRGLIKN